jgi:hypothetical protein
MHQTKKIASIISTPVSMSGTQSPLLLPASGEQLVFLVENEFQYAAYAGVLSKDFGLRIIRRILRESGEPY